MFNEGETCVSNMAEEATKDMVRRGIQVTTVKPTESSLEMIKRLTWQANKPKQGQKTKEIEPGFKQKLHLFKRS